MVSSAATLASRASVVSSNLHSVCGMKWICLSTCCAVPELPVLATGLRFRCTLLPARSVVRGSPCSDRWRSEPAKPRRGLRVVNSSRRKDRTEIDGEDEAGGFEPDMEALKTGFSKKFPGKALPGFSYNWNLDEEIDDEDDQVHVQSFRGGGHGRAQVVGYQSPTRQNSRKGNDSDKVFRPGKSREALRAYESSISQDGTRTGARQQGSTSQQRAVESGAFRQGSENFGRQGIGDKSGAARKQGSGVGSAGKRPVAKANATKISKQLGRRREHDGGAESESVQAFEDEKRKKKPVIEPVNFMSPMTKIPHVAILGGGMSGLVCALTLEGHGIQSTVFDTGKHGLGGRMATRFVETHERQKLVFDHAAQFFTVTNPRFQKLVDHWIAEGVVKEWRGNIGKLQAGGRYSELHSATRYIGTNGMRSLADNMLSQSKKISVERPCWISHMTAADGQWKLAEGRTPQGQFDVVVIAHNGKCANRLLSTAHVPLITRQMKRLELSSIWALLAAFDKRLALPDGQNLDGAFVEGIDSLSWMGNNSGKLFSAAENGPECWTFLSSAAYGKKNKVPQESIPTVKARKVQEDMLRGVGVALGLADDSLPVPIFTRLQLWGAALPTNTPSVPCIFEARSRVGICGDWLLGSSLEAAALSGIAMADHIANYRDHGEDNPEDFNIGLQQSLSALEGGHDIGQFPGAEDSFEQPSEKELLAVT